MNAFKSSIWRIRGLIKKEFIAMLMDKGTRMVLIVPVIVQSLIFGYGVNFTLERVQYALFDNSHSKISQDIIFSTNNSAQFALVANCNDLQCLRKTVDSGKALIGIYFPPDFAKNREIAVISDARNTASANTAVSYLQSVVSDYNANEFGSGGINLTYRYIFNENNITRYTILVGMILALSMIQVMLLAGFSVAREREEGSFDMLLMTPTNPFEILIGKAVAPICVAIIQGLLLCAICYFYFKIPLRGRFLDLFALITLFSICNVGLGLAVSSYCKTSLQAIVWSFMIILPSVMLSGLLTPAEAMPSWFLPVTYIDPMFYANNCIWRIYLEGTKLFDLWKFVLPMILIGAVSMSIASYLFRNKLD